MVCTPSLILATHRHSGITARLDGVERNYNSGFDANSIGRLLSIPPPPMRKFLQLLAVLKLFPRVPAMINTTLKSSNHPLAAYIGG